jgi:hypothetical protein
MKSVFSLSDKNENAYKEGRFYALASGFEQLQNIKYRL